MLIFRQIYVEVSSYANRGNVAVICWNTLNSKTWYVTSEDLDGKVSLGQEDTKTLLAINFPDFTTDAGKFKETEDNVIVTSTPSRDKNIGDRQIILEDVAKDYAFDFESNPKKSKKETTTYKKGDDVVAYVPEEVCKDLDSLKGHKITVVFGEDNVVALIVVEDDTVNGEFVEKYNAKKDEITIAGKKYDFAKDAEIYVNDMETETTMATILTTLGQESDKDFTKKVNANIVLDEDGDIERLDLYVSGTYTAFNTIEGVVTKNNRNILTYYYGSTWSKDTYDYEDELDDDKLPRITIDGAKGYITDIEAGNIITMYYGEDKDDVLAIHVSTNIVNGEVTKTKKDGNKIYVDGEEYCSSMTNVLATDDEIKDATSTGVVLGDTIAKKDEVELYVNIYGEYVVVRTEEGATEGWTFAYVRSIKDVDENDADQLVATLRLLLADGSKPATYSIVVDIDDYNPRLTQGNTTKIEEFEDYVYALVGEMIAFKANSENEIVIDEVTTNGYDFDKLSLVDTSNTTPKFDKDYTVVAATKTAADVDDDRETIEVSNKVYDFNSGKTKIFVTPEEKVYTKWNSIVSNDKLVEDALLVLDGNDIEYMIFAEKIDATSDELFATYKNVDSDEITLFNGSEETIAHTGDAVEDKANDISKNAFVEYVLNSKDEVKDITSLIDVKAFRDEDAVANIISESDKTKLADKVKLAMATETKVDAKVVAGSYTSNDLFNTAVAGKAFYVHKIENFFPADGTYKVIQTNPTLAVAYPADYADGIKTKTYTNVDISVENDMSILLANNVPATLEVYDASNKLVALYTFNNVSVSVVTDESKVSAKTETSFVKDLFAVESTGSLKFTYVDELKDEYGIDTLGTIKVDEDTVVYDLRDNDFKVVDFDDFKTIVETETVYVIPFVNGTKDAKADANMLVIVE